MTVFAHFPSLHNIGIFAAAALLLALTPGPGMMYVTARTLSGGKPDGLASAFGAGLGGLFHVLIATIGLSALLAASARAFTIVKYVGAAYLLFLGVRAIVQARHAQKFAVVKAHGPRRAFLEGALTEALNVKTALFFLAFIPQFVDHAQAAAPQFALLGTLCVVLNTSVDFMVVMLAHRLAKYFRGSAKPARRLQYVSGSVLLGLGTYLALSD
jgi:threonine/homoserine/homoserine lactone efflux protein